MDLKSAATGFLVGHPLSEPDSDGKQTFGVFLITNRHVYEKKTGEKIPELVVRFNNTGDEATYCSLNLLTDDGSPVWYCHDEDNVDVAVIPLNSQSLINANIEFEFFRTNMLMYARDFEKAKIGTGDGIFVLGFPMGISGKKKNYVIARSGIVARVDKELLSEGIYYIDAAIYEGNSGGPVIHKPEVISVSGTGSNNDSGLMGMVRSVAYFRSSMQTQVETTGLASVVPVERIYEVIEKIMADSQPRLVSIVIRQKIGVATEVETALPIKATKEVQLGAAKEISEALPIESKTRSKK